MRRLINPKANLRSFLDLSRIIARFRELIIEMVRRDLVERHSGSFLGGFWAIGQPLVVMVVYSFVFSYIYDIRLSGAFAGVDYLSFMLSGLVPWLGFQEALARAPHCILDSKNLVKQIVFPIEILPLKIVFSSTVVLAIGLVFPMGILIVRGDASLMWLLLPLPILSHLTLLAGLAFFLSAVTVFVRDVRNIIQLLLMIGLFVHPILYTPGMLPSFVEKLMTVSPLSHVIWVYRDVLVFGRITEAWSWLIAPVSGLVVLILGFRSFQSLRHAFGDAL